MTVDTPFDLASLTKLFTSVAAVQQIERGTLGIDARVGAYLPDFTGAARHGVTVRQLLTHTSGLRPELPLYDCADDAERLALLRAEQPVGVPGTYCYSDLNMLLLQHLLERLTGRPLDTLVHDGITRPLGMTATDFGPCPGAAATEDQRRPWGKADRGLVRGEVHDENAWALGGAAGHAGPFSAGHGLLALPRPGGHRGPAAAGGEGGPRAGGGRGARRDRLGAGRGRRPRRTVLHRPRPGRLLPGPAGRRLLRARPHPRLRLRGPAVHAAGPGIRPGPAVVHGGPRGPGRGGPHRLHRHVPRPGPGDGHLPGPARQHRPPAPPPHPGQRAPGTRGLPPGAGGAGPVTVVM